VLDRFNFYDVYGYVVPGLVLLGLLAMPQAVVSGSAPSPDIGTAALYILGAYVVGHILHRISSKVFGHGAMAEALLTPQNPSLSPWAKAKVRALILARFDLDLDSEGTTREAFHLCRAALAQGKASRYLEQFQSLYVAMRHIATALVLGACFAYGWGVREFSTWSGLAFLPITVFAAGLMAGIVWWVLGPANKDTWEKARSSCSSVTGRWKARRCLVCAWLRLNPSGWFVAACFGLCIHGFLEAPDSWARRADVGILFASVVVLLASHKLLLRAYADHSDNYAREVFMSFITLETYPRKAADDA
jgi:hypothetical protein